MKLKSGDIVDIIAPSSAPKNKKWKKGIQILQGWGLKVRLAHNALSPWLFHSHNNSRRSHFLNQAFLRKDSSAVWMLRGGYGMQKLLPSFTKHYSKPTPKKIFIGYSDGTALHLFLNGRKQKTLHAPTIGELPDLSKKELAHLKNILFGLKKEVNFKKLDLITKSKKRNIKADIIGGNLSILSSSIGTPWFPSLKSHFLFIEDINEEDYKIDRMLFHLLHSGVLKGVKALLFGPFPPLKYQVLKNILKAFYSACPIPMVFGLPCGHKTLSSYALPLKSPAELILQKDKAELKIKN